MADRLVLVDSSVWIHEWTGRGGALARSLRRLVDAHRAAINDVIRMELLTGARDEEQYEDLADALRGLHPLPLSDPVWEEAARLRFDVRRAGHLVPVPDALVAACAFVHGCELLHADRHFERIAAVRSRLRLFRCRRG